jgi:hypothetical protein
MGRLLRTVAVVLTTSVVVHVATGSAAVRQTRTVDSKLVGKWTRTITKADVKRSAGGLILGAGRLATLTIRKNGHWTAVIAGLGGLGTVDGAAVPAGAGRIHFNVEGEAPSVYAWRVSGKVLTLTKVTDAVPDRRLFFVGVWKRK